MDCNSLKVSENTTREKCGATETAVAEKEENVEHADSQVMSSLPPEILLHILSFCETSSLGRLRRVSHHLKSIVDYYIERLPRSANMLRRSRKEADCDGEYILAVTSDRFGIVPLRVYCHRMSTEYPKEYITLRHDGPDDNFSELTEGGLVTGPGVRTSFRKVRLDVAKMQLVCSDFTFAESDGFQYGLMEQLDGEFQTLFKHMPLGTAQNGSNWRHAIAKVDLRGTGLCIDCSFYLYGVDASGHFEFKEGRQMVSISGRGLPGGCGPKSAMLAHYKSYEYEMRGGPVMPLIKNVWDEFGPVIMKVDIACRGYSS